MTALLFDNNLSFVGKVPSAADPQVLLSHLCTVRSNVLYTAMSKQRSRSRGQLPVCFFYIFHQFIIHHGFLCVESTRVLFIVRGKSDPSPQQLQGPFVEVYRFRKSFGMLSSQRSNWTWPWCDILPIQSSRLQVRDRSCYIIADTKIFDAEDQLKGTADDG
jgi:hypothetical protein